MTTGSVIQKDTTTINIYAPNNRTLKYWKQKKTELKEERDNLITEVGDLNLIMLNNG